MNILLVIDMQNDFINGALGTKEAFSIVDDVVEKVKNFNGKVFFTRDTHKEDYLDTIEGKNLPVLHCIEGTKGWEICDKLKPFVKNSPFNKPTFASIELKKYLLDLSKNENIESIELVGLCTDVCVISNAMLIKANFSNIPIIVDSSLCAGVTIESHERALGAMRMCHISIK